MNDIVVRSHSLHRKQFDRLQELTEVTGISASDLVRRLIDSCYQDPIILYSVLPLNYSGQIHIGDK